MPHGLILVDLLGVVGVVVHDVELAGQQVCGTTCQRGRGGGRAEGTEVDLSPVSV